MTLILAFPEVQARVCTAHGFDMLPPMDSFHGRQPRTYLFVDVYTPSTVNKYAGCICEQLCHAGVVLYCITQRWYRVVSWFWLGSHSQVRVLGGRM